MGITDKISKMIGKKDYKIFSDEDYERYRWAFRFGDITTNRYENEEEANNAAEMLVRNNVVSHAEVKPVTVFEKDDIGEVRKHTCYDMIFDGRDIYYYRENKDSYSDREYYLAFNEYIKAIKSGGNPKIRVMGWLS